jgi:hypothetical protein
MLDDNQVECRLIITRAESLLNEEALKSKTAEQITDLGHKFLRTIQSSLEEAARSAVDRTFPEMSLKLKTCRLHRNHTVTFRVNDKWCAYCGRNVAIMWFPAGLHKPEALGVIAEAIEGQEWMDGDAGVKLKVSTDSLYFANMPAPTSMACRILNVPADVDRENSPAFILAINTALSRRGLKDPASGEPIATVAINIGPDIRNSGHPSQHQEKGTGAIFFDVPGAPQVLMRGINADIFVAWHDQQCMVTFKPLSAAENDAITSQHRNDPQLHRTGPLQAPPSLLPGEGHGGKKAMSPAEVIDTEVPAKDGYCMVPEASEASAMVVGSPPPSSAADAAAAAASAVAAVAAASTSVVPAKTGALEPAHGIDLMQQLIITLDKREEKMQLQLDRREEKMQSQMNTQNQILQQMMQMLNQQQSHQQQSVMPMQQNAQMPEAQTAMVAAGAALGPVPAGSAHTPAGSAHTPAAGTKRQQDRQSLSPDGLFTTASHKHQTPKLDTSSTLAVTDKRDQKALTTRFSPSAHDGDAGFLAGEDNGAWNKLISLAQLPADEQAELTAALDNRQVTVRRLDYTVPDDNTIPDNAVLKDMYRDTAGLATVLSWQSHDSDRSIKHAAITINIPERMSTSIKQTVENIRQNPPSLPSTPAAHAGSDSAQGIGGNE